MIVEKGSFERMAAKSAHILRSDWEIMVAEVAGWIVACFEMTAPDFVAGRTGFAGQHKSAAETGSAVGTAPAVSGS